MRPAGSALEKHETVKGGEQDEAIRLLMLMCIELWFNLTTQGLSGYWSRAKKLEQERKDLGLAGRSILGADGAGEHHVSDRPVKGLSSQWAK